jgi:hypothetical protein
MTCPPELKVQLASTVDRTRDRLISERRFVRSRSFQIALTHIAKVAMNRLTVTNDMTSWKSSLIGKTLHSCRYVSVLFFFCSKVKHTKAPIGAMVFETLTEGKMEWVWWIRDW